MLAWTLSLSVTIALFDNTISLPERKYLNHVVSVSLKYVRNKTLFS